MRTSLSPFQVLDLFWPAYRPGKQIYEAVLHFAETGFKILLQDTPPFPSRAWQMLCAACQILDNCLSSIPSSSTNHLTSSIKHLSSMYEASIKHLWSNHQASVKQPPSNDQASVKQVQVLDGCLVLAWQMLGGCFTDASWVLACQMLGTCLSDALCRLADALCCLTDALCCLTDAWGDAWQAVVKYLTCSTKHLSSAWWKRWCSGRACYNQLLHWIRPAMSNTRGIMFIHVYQRNRL